MGLIRDLVAVVAVGKAAPTVDRLPVAGSSTVSGGVGSGAASNTLGFLGALSTSAVLFSVVDRIASAVASTTWRLYRKAPSGRRVEVLSHPALDLIKSLNPFFTQQEFFELSSSHFDLVGETWWIILRNAVGQPVELQIVRPDRMKVIPHPEAYIAGYIYTLGAEKIPLETKDVIFIRRPSPVDPYRGIGPIQALLVDIGSEQLAATWTRNFFSNSAEPGGIIELGDAEMDDIEFERYTARWRAQHSGVANAHRVAVLEKGTWKDRKTTQRDMQFEQMRKFHQSLVLLAFGVHPAIIGISENVNRANAEAAEVSFARWVIRPRLTRTKQALNERLLPNFGADSGLEFDFEDPVPDDRLLDLEEADRSYLGGYGTKDEARAKIGLPPVADGTGDTFREAPMALALPDGRLLQRALPEPGQAPSLAALRRLIEGEVADNWETRLGQERDRILEHLERNWAE